MLFIRSRSMKKFIPNKKTAYSIVAGLMISSGAFFAISGCNSNKTLYGPPPVEIEETAEETIPETELDTLTGIEYESNEVVDLYGPPLIESDEQEDETILETEPETIIGIEYESNEDVCLYGPPPVDPAETEEETTQAFEPESLTGIEYESNELVLLYGPPRDRIDDEYFITIETESYESEPSETE